MKGWFAISNEQKIVRAFFKECLSWRAESVGTWIGAGFVEMLFLLFVATPAQEIFGQSDVDRLFLIYGVILGWLAPFLYIMPYVTFKEDKKDCSITAKLKYLPVSLREIQKMRAWYVIRFVAIQFPVALVLQMMTSWFSYHEITWMNIIYVIWSALIWPLITNLSVAVWSRRYS